MCLRTTAGIIGALPILTAFSFDSWVFENRNGPSKAYAFARGETLKLPPLNKAGQGSRPITIDRPLDFAAVTDHAEQRVVLLTGFTPFSHCIGAFIRNHDVGKQHSSKYRHDPDQIFASTHRLFRVAGEI
ncbi:MAG: DUF3604 domain-containing protein [Pseudomonadales bacterium]